MFPACASWSLQFPYNIDRKIIIIYADVNMGSIELRIYFSSTNMEVKRRMARKSR